ncbi:MAG: formate dehydrogenase accessory sulfurtransferase FdhD [Acidimicrobiia bacterium]
MSTPSTRRPVTPVRVRAIEDGRLVDRPDRLVTEEPMEIRIHGVGQDAEAVAVTMRTPGHDFELAVGLCRTEGLLQGAGDLAEVRYCLAEELGQEQEYNVVTVAVRRPVDLGDHRRVVAASSSCGICGKTTLDEVAIGCSPVAPGPVIARSTLVDLPDTLRKSQTVFDATGGLHAAGLFSPGGELRLLREDVGRHNAVDKLIGHAVMADQLPLADSVLMVSGRLSFEIVQKAAVAGIPIVGAVSAPSSLAVATAERFEQTLVGFLRDGRGNVYSHPERIDAGR